MSSYSCHRHCQQSPGQECAAAGEAESRGCSAHLGPAPCWVWGEPSPENAERWVCPRTSTVHLLLALMASHGTTHPRHGDRSCSSLGTSTGLAFFLQGSRNEPQLMSSLWLLTCSLPAGQGPGSSAWNKPGPAQPWRGPNTTVLCAGVGDGPVPPHRALLLMWGCCGGCAKGVPPIPGAATPAGSRHKAGEQLPCALGPPLGF